MTERLKLLLLDDEPIVGKRLKPALAKIGCDVEVFENPAEALVRINEEEFDIVVTDIRMEGMDGLEILEHIRKKSSRTKVIMITGYAMMETARGASFILDPAGARSSPREESVHVHHREDGPSCALVLFASWPSPRRSATEGQDPLRRERPKEPLSRLGLHLRLSTCSGLRAIYPSPWIAWIFQILTMTGGSTPSTLSSSSSASSAGAWSRRRAGGRGAVLGQDVAPASGISWPGGTASWRGSTRRWASAARPRSLRFELS